MFRAALANSPSGNDVVSEEDNIIVADALANGYINSQTDATNAANTLSGRAWVVDTGTPATMSNGLTAVPEGTKSTCNGLIQMARFHQCIKQAQQIN